MIKAVRFSEKTMQACSRLMQDIVACPKPVIAAVDGIATAAGCQLVASCDLAVATSSSHFATPGVNIGLFCSTPMVAVSRNISRKRVMEMLLMGEMISAETAAQWGLINRVIDEGKAEEDCSQYGSKSSRQNHQPRLRLVSKPFTNRPKCPWIKPMTIQHK